MSETRILVVEDEPTIARAVADRLAAEGFAVDTAADGPSAVERARAFGPHLVVLDVMLPGFDGLEVCRRVQAERAVPVLMLTARDDETDLLVGLGVGADDYVTKPFSVNELIARMRAILRRAARPTSAPEVVAIGEAQVNFSSHSLKALGQEHALSFYEVELLRLLSERMGQPVSRDEILQKIWGLDASPTNRTVDNFIVKLRKKIETHPDKPAHILTVYGYGYKLV